MIERRYRHFLIGMSNKLFVIGGESDYSKLNSLEILDSTSRTFTYVENGCYDHTVGACCVGYKIILIILTLNGEYNFAVYDTHNK